MLNHSEFLKTYIVPFENAKHVFNYRGWIVWRVGTGNNVELLHIKTRVRGKGYGRELVYDMLDKLQSNPPYYSVFGFTRDSNEEAKKFYGALGFNLHPVPGLYASGNAVMFYQSYEELWRLRREHL